MSRFSEGLSRLRRGALWLLFAVVLLIPKTLGLRRHPRTWNVLRIAAVLLGAAGVALALHGRAHIWGIAGTLLAIVGLVIPPERNKLSVDQRARELGAIVVVQGGEYRANGAGPAASGGNSVAASDAHSVAVSDRNLTAVRLFLGPDRLWVLDAALRTLIEIPLAQITSFRAEPEGQLWRLRLVWGTSTTDFLYRGAFCEHLARVAESALRSQLSRELPILQ